MFEKILYPTDFSDTARKAMGVVKELRTAGAQEVVALHVIDQRSIDTLNEFAASSVPTLELEEEVSINMGQLENELRGAGLSVVNKIVHGLPLSEILKTADEERVSAIVIGSHGKSNIGEMLLGSVSEKVVRKARQPVLVVKR
ncbi:MAG: universal stress protein [Syntrophaceae bacterium]